MRCSDCDREDCPMLSLGDMPATREMSMAEAKIAVDEHVRAVHSAHMDCNAHRVDWRARALTAEAQVAAAREAVTEWPEARHHRAFCGSLEIRPYGPRHACNCGVDKQNGHRMTARRALGLEE